MAQMMARPACESGLPPSQTLVRCGLVSRHATTSFQWYARSGELRGREIAQRFWDLFMRGMFEATAGAERRAPAA